MDNYYCKLVVNIDLSDSDLFDSVKDAIPLSTSNLSPRAQDIHKRVKDLINDEIIPREKEFREWYTDPETMWTINPILDEITVVNIFVILILLNINLSFAL